MASRDFLAGAGGLTTGLFKGITTGIALHQRQQIIDREKLESELGLFNSISKLPEGPFRKAAMARFLPRIGFSQDVSDMLLKANEEEQQMLNTALNNVLEQLPSTAGLSQVKGLIGKLTPEQLIKFVDIGLKIEKFKSENVTQQALSQIGAEGFGVQAPSAPTEGVPAQGPGFGQPSQPSPTSSFDQRIANLDKAIAKATAIGTEDALKLVRVLQAQRTELQQDRRRMEGMSDVEFKQRLEIAKETGAEKHRLEQEMGKLDATVQQAVSAHTENLANINFLLENFSEEEISKFVGFLNRPFHEAMLAVRGIFGQEGSERFAEFKAAAERIRNAAFQAGGKQLTPFEASVVFGFTPTGREAGGGKEFLAKARNLERFSRSARKLRLELARKGKGSIEESELDVLIRKEMGSLLSPKKNGGPPKPKGGIGGF